MRIKAKIRKLLPKTYAQKIRYISVTLASLLSLATVYELFTAYSFVVEMTKFARLQRNANLNQIKTPDEVIRLAFHLDRKSTRLNSSHVSISYAVFSLKK